MSEESIDEQKTKKARQVKPNEGTKAEVNPKKSAEKSKEDEAETKIISISFKEQRNKLIAGITLVVIAAYLFIAFTSFIFTWEVDQDKVLSGSWNLLSNADIKVTNWLGKFGAIVSHGFIHSGFGIASFLLIPIFLC